MKKTISVLGVIIALVIGFAVGIILMGILIYFGYSYAYRTGIDQYTVRLFGLSIYELTRIGTQYNGASIGKHMGLVCGACMVISFAAEQMLCRLWRRRSR